MAAIVLGAVLPLRADDAPLPPESAARRMTLPPGFEATLFAGEPDVVQPIAFTFDDRGRLWVVECLSYPDWDRGGPDRILIFDDRDGDGRFDDRKVFWDQGKNLSGIAFGFGGVWLCSTPNFLFLPDRDGDDTPDGPPTVLLDGWDLDGKHNVFNGLTWGPDGWLYGANGILSNSRVGRPGTPDTERVELNCGVWRYHPTRHVFESIAWGTTNPWGLDFDDFGRMFITNCVIKHLFHVIPGGHYVRMFGTDFNPHLYELLPSCADHIHWAGGPWQEVKKDVQPHQQAGGGHAHAGAMIYLGDNWPDAYRNGLFTCNIHGTRVNHDRLDPEGSGYRGRHEPDFLVANDPWFRGLELKYGPDGGVYLTDWTDIGECHDYEHVDRSNGRIFKITYGEPAPARIDLAAMSDAELVELHLHKNDWQVRHARRLLHERAAAGRLDASTIPSLRTMLHRHPDVTRKLRALWALHVTGGLNDEYALSLLDHANEHIRAWSVRLIADETALSEAQRKRLTQMAADDHSPVVRLALASALQKWPAVVRWDIAAALAARSEDASDANLPLMIWYGLEPLVPTDASRAAVLLERARIPLIREFIARRIAAQSDLSGGALDPIVEVLDRSRDADVQLDALRGLHAALRGRRHLPRPAKWPTVFERLSQSKNAQIRESIFVLGLVFGDDQARITLRQLATNANATREARRSALQFLIQQREADLTDPLLELLADADLRDVALRGLAAYDDPRTPAAIVRAYASMSDAERRDAVATLAARAGYALALLDAVEHGRIPRGHLSAFTVRQLVTLRDAEVTRRLNEVWGRVTSPGRDKRALIRAYRQRLSPAAVREADVAHGRAVFHRTCAACHRLFDDGGDVGPELTGGQRANLDYVLENLLDPNAVVGRDYQLTIIVTADGRTLSGIVKQEDDNTVTIRTQNETVILAHEDIDRRMQSALSMMPEDLLTSLPVRDVRALVAYLASPVQVPLPAETP